MDRCGEDERPLDELLMLQLGAEHLNERYNLSMGTVFESCWKKTSSSGSDSNLVQKFTLLHFYTLIINLS